MEVVIDQKQLCKPTELFKKPFVVELMGAGFDRPANVNYWTLRFPRIQKIHDDRTLGDVVSFVELQKLAREHQHLAPEKVDQRKNLWLTRLRDSDQRAQHADSMTSQAASEHFERNDLQYSRDKDRSVEDQSRTISLEIADCQRQHLLS